MKSSEIKQAALSQLKGNWSKAFSITTIFTLVNIALSYGLTFLQNITTKTPILYYGVNIIYLAIFLPLSFSLIASIRKLIKGKKIDNTTFLNDAILNSTKIIAIFIRTLLKMILPSIIIIIGVIGILFLTAHAIPLTQANASGYAIFIVALSTIIFVGISLSALPYTLSSYILTDNKDLKSNEIIMQSALLMKNKKLEFIKLILSFLGWFLLLAILATFVGMLTFESMTNYVQWFGMIFLIPYLIASISIFYEEALDTKEVILENSENR